MRETRPASGSKSGRHEATPLSLEQLESRMMCTVNNLLDSLELLGASNSASKATVKTTNVNKAPSFVGAVTVSGGTTIRTREATFSALARDDQAESALTYRWSTGTVPPGGTVTFNVNNSNAAKTTKATFNKAGVYELRVTATDRGGLSTTSIQRVTVAMSQSGLQVVNRSATVATDSTINSSSASEQFTVRAVDQWGNALTTQPSVSWSQVSAPSGGASTIRSAGNTTTISFNQAGTYKFRVQSGSLVTTFSVKVNSSLARLTVAPGSTEIQAGARQQFVASGFDQFNKPMTVQPTWTTTSGTITSGGLLTSPNAAGNLTVTATSGSIRGTATVVVKAATGLQSNNLSNLVSTLFADGSINRTDMMQLLRSAGTDGVVDASELTDLRYVVSNASNYRIPEFVQVLANNVVNGNAANASYLGSAAGNLVAGSAGSLMTILVDKWFMGTDLPTVTGNGISYRAATGSLFVGTPSRANELQGQLGDCYLIATLGAIADRNPTAISNMFVDNGDGTFTVRFYTGNYSMFYAADGTVSDGFANGTSVADYVTVNRQLPVYSNGTFAYSNYGKSITDTSVPLWIALAEKAYAQWNATGKSGRNGTNTYAGIEGGWMGRVNAQVLGTNATAYYMNSATEQSLISALSAGKAVTIGSKSGSSDLVGSHAYSVIGYDATSQKFTLYNPWGFMQPAPLTWAQLQANCSMFSVANAVSTPIAMTRVSAAAPIVRSVAGSEGASLLVLNSSSFSTQLDTETDRETLSQFESYRFSAIGDQLEESSNLVIDQPTERLANDWDAVVSETPVGFRELTPALVDSALEDIDSLLAELA